MSKQVLLNQIKASKEYLDRATSVLTEADSTISPTEGMMTAAQQIAHVAHTVDWFIEGVFGAGFDMDFEGSLETIGKVTSLTEARAWCTRAFDAALATIESKSSWDRHRLLPCSPASSSIPHTIAAP